MGKVQQWNATVTTHCLDSQQWLQTQMSTSTVCTSVSLHKHVLASNVVLLPIIIDGFVSIQSHVLCILRHIVQVIIIQTDQGDNCILHSSDLYNQPPFFIKEESSERTEYFTTFNCLSATAVIAGQQETNGGLRNSCAFSHARFHKLIAIRFQVQNNFCFLAAMQI